MRTLRALAIVGLALGGCGGAVGDDAGEDESTTGSETGAVACEDADLERDEAHCGACDVACASDEDCLAGSCTADEEAGLNIVEPERGYDRTFVMPALRWGAVEGATEYEAVVARDAEGTDVVVQTTQAETSWSPGPFMGSTYWLTVTATPSGESATRPFVVRGFTAGSEIPSPTPVCDDPGGATSPFSYALARAGDRLYATVNGEGGGLCVHDVESMDHLLTVPGPAPNFRAYGVASDPERDRIFASFFPINGMCGDTLERVLVLDDASTTFTTRFANAGTEAAHSLGFAAGRLFMSGLNGVSCFDESGWCLDLGAPCTNGNGAFVGLDLDVPAFAFQGTDEWASPGMHASPDFVVRPGLDGGLGFSSFDGAPLFSAPTTDGARGIQRWDAEGEAFLIVGEFDDTIRIYRLAAVPPSSADDVEWVNEVAVPERFWQGDHDEAGRFWFPGQASRGLYRMDITP